MFVYELDIRTFGELWYFLVRRKHCPRCGRKRYRVDVLPEFSSGLERDGLQFEHTYRTKDFVRYRCDPCQAYFTLAELASGSRKVP